MLAMCLGLLKLTMINFNVFNFGKGVYLLLKVISNNSLDAYNLE